MSKEDAEVLARTENAKYRQEMNDQIEAGVMSKKDRGPVAATVVDRRTGEVFQGINNRRKKPPDPLDPILQRRINELSDNPQHPSTPGSHAEVWALNAALMARRRAGNPVNEADLDEFTMLPVWTKGTPTTGNLGEMIEGEDAPRCGNCQILTRGVHNLTGDAPLQPRNSP
jgi:hypothetical protein